MISKFAEKCVFRAIAPANILFPRLSVAYLRYFSLMKTKSRSFLARYRRLTEITFLSWSATAKNFQLSAIFKKQTPDCFGVSHFYNYLHLCNLKIGWLHFEKMECHRRNVCVRSSRSDIELRIMSSCCWGVCLWQHSSVKKWRNKQMTHFFPLATRAVVPVWWLYLLIWWRSRPWLLKATNDLIRSLEERWHSHILATKLMSGRPCCEQSTISKRFCSQSHYVAVRQSWLPPQLIRTILSQGCSLCGKNNFFFFFCQISRYQTV